MSLPAANDYITRIQSRVSRVEGLDPSTAVRKIERVGVIGAGTMGGGISMNFANVGVPVTIVETTQAALDRGFGVIRKNYERSASRGRFPRDEVEVRMDRLNPSLDMADLADCDLIIEAVFEDMALKKSLFGRLDAIARPGAILATNTSGLDIDEIAAETGRPGDVIGMHFFSPANVMKLLEVVRAEHTAEDVVATAMQLAPTIGKIAALVGVCPGFVGNRMLAYRGIGADALVRQGVMPWDIDAAFNNFGFKMGPFQMSDLAGLDIGWKKGTSTSNPIRDALCEMDRRGQKTGAGYYDYDDDRNRTPSGVTAGIIRDITGTDGTTRVSEEDILARCIFPMINEGLKILEEGKAQRAGDIDVIWLYGYGWPADKGGPMYYGDRVGAGAVLAQVEKMAASDERLSPAGTLRRLAGDGGRFIDLESSFWTKSISND
jgi:3-hydroxyacyl-CoA dehydrogenase